MRRDMELVRSILLRIEEASEPNLSDLIGEGVTEEDAAQFVYNLGLLVDAGFVAGTEAHTLKGQNWLGLQLTWQGHEFLDAVRDPEIWRRTKQGAKAAGLNGVKVIFDIAVAYGKQLAKEKLGLDLP